MNIFSRGKIFIENLGEFSPFGAKLMHDSIKDVIFYNDEMETLDTKTAIKILQENLAKDLKENKGVEAVAYAYDVVALFNNADGVTEKRDALCLRISTDGKIWSEEYFPYMIINGECFWRQILCPKINKQIHK